MTLLVPIVAVFAISLFTTRRYFARVSAEKRSKLLYVASLSVAFTFAFIASRGHAGAWPLLAVLRSLLGGRYPVSRRSQTNHPLLWIRPGTTVLVIRKSVGAGRATERICVIPCRLSLRSSQQPPRLAFGRAASTPIGERSCFASCFSLSSPSRRWGPQHPKIRRNRPAFSS